MDANLETEIIRLKGLNLRQLRRYWESHLGEETPSLRSADTIRRLLAYKFQEIIRGGLPPATRKKLRKIASDPSRNPVPEPPQGPRLKPGTVLTREWQGTLHQVRALDDGFEFEGKRLASLSEAARKIVGTRWSGPLFFGLKK
ncbi:MAG: DUF2924 domain-containing protein [Nitrospinota bacterium]